MNYFDQLKDNIAKLVFAATTALVVSIVCGAAAIVWKGVTTIDDQVKSSTAVISKQSDYLIKTIEVLQRELRLEKEQRMDDDNIILHSINQKQVIRDYRPEDFIQKQLPPVSELKQAN